MGGGRAESPLLRRRGGARAPAPRARRSPDLLTRAGPSGARFAALAVLFSLLWASAFVAVKVALRDCPPLALMAARFLVAGALLAGWAAARPGRSLPRTAREWAAAALLGCLTQSAYLGLSGLALTEISAGVAALLASTNPVMLALVAPGALGERLTAGRVLGLGVGFAGVVTVLWSRLGPDNHPRGVLLTLVAVACFVAGTLVFKRLPKPRDLLGFNGAQLLIGGAVLAVPSLVLEPVGAIRLSGTLLLGFGWLVAAVSGAAMLIWFWLLSHGEATRASAWFFLNPVLGVGFGALLLGEPLGLADALGAAAVGLGLYLVSKPRGR